MQELLDSQQACGYLGIAISTLKKYVSTGKVNVTEKRNGRNYFDPHYLDRFKKSHIQKHKQKTDLSRNPHSTRGFNAEERQVINLWCLHEKDTGSADVQIGLLSLKIDKCTDDLKRCHEDPHQYKIIRLMLMQAVGARRKKLEYLQNTDVSRYVRALEKLKLEKRIA